MVGTIESHFKGGDRQPVARTAEQVAALVAYLETLEPPASPFDQGTLSAAARRGEELFQGKGGCIDCHAGPLLTDVGAAQHARPEGRTRATPTPARRARARSPGRSTRRSCATCATPHRTCTMAPSRT